MQELSPSGGGSGASVGGAGRVGCGSLIDRLRAPPTPRSSSAPSPFSLLGTPERPGVTLSTSSPASPNSTSSGEFEVASSVAERSEGGAEDGVVLESQLQMRTVLCHTVVCLGDTRWEVRRMAEQVLSALTEVLCWFDIARLDELWTEMLHSSSVQLVFVSLTALRHALRKCQTLRALLPPLAHAEATGGEVGSRARVEAVIVGVGSLLPKLAGRVHALACGAIEGGISILAAEVLMMMHTDWAAAVASPLPNDSRKIGAGRADRNAELRAVVAQLLALHRLEGGAAAVPVLALLDSVQSSIREAAGNASAEIIQQAGSALEGPRPAQLGIVGQKRGAAHLRSLVTRAVSWLPDFMLTLSWRAGGACEMLPLLACWLIMYEEVNIQMSLCEAISRTLSIPLAFILGSRGIEGTALPQRTVVDAALGSQLKPPAFGQRPSPFDGAASGGVPQPVISPPQSAPAFGGAVQELHDGFATGPASGGLPFGLVERVCDYLVESVLLQLVEQRNLEVPILRR